MTEERFREIFSADYTGQQEGDTIFQGLKIIEKYISPLKSDIIIAAEHDEIFSVDIAELITADISEEDIISLRNFGWRISERGGLSHFV
jgi:hypothetical protein